MCSVTASAARFIHSSLLVDWCTPRGWPGDPGSSGASLIRPLYGKKPYTAINQSAVDAACACCWLRQQLQVVRPLTQADVARVVDVQSAQDWPIATPPHHPMHVVGLTDRWVVHPPVRPGLRVGTPRSGPHQARPELMTLLRPSSLDFGQHVGPHVLAELKRAVRRHWREPARRARASEASGRRERHEARLGGTADAARARQRSNSRASGCARRDERAHVASVRATRQAAQPISRAAHLVSPGQVRSLRTAPDHQPGRD